MASSEEGQAAIQELRDALEGTFNMLTQMTDRANSDDLRTAPLPSNKKSLEFIRAVLEHNFTQATIADLVKSLRDMRSDVETCLTELEATFQHVLALYDVMKNGLTPITSRGSIFSTATNLTARIKLAAWLNGWEETWRPFRQREPTPVGHPSLSRTPFYLIIGSRVMTFQLRQLPKWPSDPPRTHPACLLA